MIKQDMTIAPAERRYVIKKTDPAYGLLKSIAVGFGCMEPGTRVECPNPLLNTLAIEMTIAGHAALHYSDQKVGCKSGTVMLMLPKLKFYDLVGQEPWRSCWFVLWGPLADTFVTDSNRSSCAIALSDVPGPIRLNMFEACRLILEQPHHWQWLWLRHLTSVLEYVREAVSNQSEEGSTFVKKARRLMEENLATPLPIPEIAEMLNISLSTFSHQFKKEAGDSPGKVYRQMRIEKSKELIAKGLSVTETSIQMGFENPFHFSRLFKSNEGLSPSQFNKQINQLALKRF